MARPHRPEIFTIPLDRAFADTLVAGIIERVGRDPMQLAQGMLLLANRRAADAVRDAFVRAAGEAVLLPRLVTLGEGDLESAAGAAFDRIEGDLAALPPAIAVSTRTFLLAQDIADIRPEAGADELFSLAQSLGQVIDELQVEEVPFAAFHALEEEMSRFSEHWQRAYGLADAILRQWPERLAALGLCDPVDRRNRQLRLTAAQWERHGLPVPWLVAAGVSTAAPAIAGLMAVISRCAGGAVVLPHLDLDLAPEQWDALGGDPRLTAPAPEPVADGHPQYHLKLLLSRMGIHRDEVRPWVRDKPDADSVRRRRFAGHMATSAAFTHEWRGLNAAHRKLPGVRLAEFATPGEEAQGIALALREVLETPGKTAALVTPDRALATRVATHLGRWGIVVDDSAGTPLGATPAGQLWLALAELAGDVSPVHLIAVLGHPMVGGEGEARRTWMDRVRELDLALRGPRPAARLDQIGGVIARRAQKNAHLATWWEGVAEALSPLTGAVELPVSALLDRLVACVGALSGDAIWTGADGRALSTWLDAHVADAPCYGAPVQRGEWASVLRRLMQGVTVRPPNRGHPRLAILGLIEARLQRADRMILGGLNEGQWPAKPSPDPWLSPQLRKMLGLPGPEFRIGLSAHDFATALGSGDVLVTRARRDGTAPAVASRLRLRIDALLGADDVEAASDTALPALAAALDQPDAIRPAPRPAFSPPANRRPRRISVTAVDTLNVDPFSFYANAMLGLRKLDRLDGEATPGWRGTLVHDIAFDWLKSGEWSVAAMDEAFDRYMDAPGVSPAMRATWAPRLRVAMHNFVGLVAEQRAQGRVPIVEAAEQRRQLDIDGVTLVGKPDRIDRLSDGTLAIVDYKTGTNPKASQVATGYAWQLGLIAVMAEAGAFTDSEEAVSTYEYWRARREGNKVGYIDVPFPKKPKDGQITAENFAERARERLRELIAVYCHGDRAFLAKRVPERASYADYDQLMRFDEWYGSMLDGGDGAA